jgi:hypothetical protein
MRKTDKIYLGDKVRTKKSFKPYISTDERFNPEGVLYDGVVVGKRGSFLLVDFEQKYPFTHYLGDLLTEPTGCAVEFKNLNIVKSFKSDDVNEIKFVGVIKQLNFEEFLKTPKEIRRTEDEINSQIGRIKSLLREVKEKEVVLEKDEFKLKELKTKKSIKNINESRIASQYKAMKKNKKIKSIEILGDEDLPNILLTTNDLMYRNANSNIPDYNLGAYKILIPLNVDESVLAINYKKHVNKFEFHHPCIKRAKMCLGTAMKEEVAKLRKTNNIINLAHLLINFLEEPNYGTPHLNEELFYCSQPVTIKPKTEMQWFDNIFWDEKEYWDGEKYTKETEIATKILDDSRVRCLSCGHVRELSDEVECSNCGDNY